jgi:hypothetical protein
VTKEEEVTIAWSIWNLLNELSTRLWERYEDGFLDRCMEECEKEHDNDVSHEPGESRSEHGISNGDLHAGTTGK